MMHKGDYAGWGGTVVDLDLAGVAGDSVERDRWLSKDHSVFEVCRAQEVGYGWGRVHKCELRVHCGKRRGLGGRKREE